MIIAGIMSGTSLDGIDVAVVEISGSGWNKKVTTLALGTRPYPATVRKALLAVSNREAHVGQVSHLNFLLPELYATAVKHVCAKARISLSSLELVGCHGQTIFHAGLRSSFLGHRISSTLQIGDGSVLAERLGVPVVSDFRTRDMAAGGQGAPLVPYVDYLLLRDRKKGRVAVNIGGIANLTAIPPGANPERVIAFDTGPGNMVADALIAHHTRGQRRFDRNGHMAGRGKVSEWLLRILLRDPFYRKPPPKSAGREDYGAEFVANLLKSGLPMEDVIATATALTSATIAQAIRRFVTPAMRVDEVVASGGGVHNAFLMKRLESEIKPARLMRTSDFGLDVDGKEAIAFAVLAYETWHRRPSNLPAATGASRSVVLGKISPLPSD